MAEDPQDPTTSTKNTKPARPANRRLRSRSQIKTAILTSDNEALRRALKQRKDMTEDASDTVSEQREIILVIRGMIERLVMSDSTTFTLGRFEPAGKQDNEIDLTPYGALDRGVSRIHARLHLEDEHLYITDLGSTNGTYLAGKRISPNQPTMLRKGDELLVGRLVIQVLFH